MWCGATAHPLLDLIFFSDQGTGIGSLWRFTPVEPNVFSLASLINLFSQRGYPSLLLSPLTP